MRVGLLPKPVAYIGVAAGLMFLLPVFGPVGLLVQAAWLAMMAILIGGRWPSGDPAAWIRGVSVPWPSGARNAAARQGARQQRQRGGARPSRTQDFVEAVAVEDDESGRTRSTTPKRKRKKR